MRWIGPRTPQSNALKTPGDSDTDQEASQCRSTGGQTMTAAPHLRRPHSALLIVLMSALLIFLLLAAVAITHSHRPDGFDASVHQWIVTHRSGALVSVAAVLTWLGSTLVVVPLMIAGAMSLGTGGLAERLKIAALPISILVLGLIARAVVVDFIARPRPPAVDWASAASGYAFPSGHTTAATLAAVLLGWLSMRREKFRSSHVLVWSLVGAWSVIVGLTRIYLGVHWPTDVLGGWAFALAWIAGSILVVRLSQGVREHPGERQPVSGP